MNMTSVSFITHLVTGFDEGQLVFPRLAQFVNLLRAGENDHPTGEVRNLEGLTLVLQRRS